MMTGIALVAVVQGGVSIPEPEAIRTYARQLAKDHLDANAGAWQWEKAGNGGFLIRYRGDFTGDGIPDLLLTSSLSTRLEPGSWLVFQGKVDGSMSLFADELSASVGSLWLSGEGQNLELICPGVPENRPQAADAGFPTPVNRYHLVFPHIEKTTETLTEEGIRNLRANAASIPKVEMLLLADFLNHRGEWTEVSQWDANSSGYLYRREDWQRAGANQEFTPHVAFELAGGEERQPKLDEKHTSLPEAAAGSLDDATRATEPGGNGGRVPLVGLAAVIVLACAIIVSAKKWRKG